MASCFTRLYLMETASKSNTVETAPSIIIDDLNSIVKVLNFFSKVPISFCHSLRRQKYETVMRCNHFWEFSFFYSSFEKMSRLYNNHCLQWQFNCSFYNISQVCLEFKAGRGLTLFPLTHSVLLSSQLNSDSIPWDWYQYHCPVSRRWLLGGRGESAGWRGGRAGGRRGGKGGGSVVDLQMRRVFGSMTHSNIPCVFLLTNGSWIDLNLSR